MAKGKKVKDKKLHRRMILLGFGSISIITVTLFTIGEYWVQIIDKYQENKNLTSKLTALKEKEQTLKVDVEKLQDPEYVARYAREKYYYSKDGEYILRIPTEEKDE